MRISEVESCSISSWISKFEDLTFETILLDIPVEVLAYLNSGSSLVLPSECDSETYFHQDNEDDDSFDGENDEAARPNFPKFSSLVKEALKSLGSAFCKLNWSSPKDASWIGSLRCDNLTQVYLLLKSSMFVSHDISCPFKDCAESEEERKEAKDRVKYKLALRKWEDINPGHEFRCFVKDRSLIGISQRDYTTFYAYITEEPNRIKEDISKFFRAHLTNFVLDDFVFDVARSSKGNIKLVDFNPFGATTDSLLFDWEDDFLNRNLEDSIDFRFVEKKSGIRADTLRQYSYPSDVVDIANGTDHEKLISFLKLQKEMQDKNNQ